MFLMIFFLTNEKNFCFPKSFEFILVSTSPDKPNWAVTLSRLDHSGNIEKNIVVPILWGKAWGHYFMRHEKMF